ncbi:MAG TPA: hypothetical protein VGE04_06500 [Chloroflexia bacterium]|jgi:hypothetical protein
MFATLPGGGRLWNKRLLVVTILVVTVSLTMTPLAPTGYADSEVTETCYPEPLGCSILSPLDGVHLFAPVHFVLAPGTSQKVTVAVDPDLEKITGISFFEIEGQNVKEPPRYGSGSGWLTDSCSVELTGQSWCCDLFTYFIEQEYNFNGDNVDDTFVRRSASTHHYQWHFAGHGPDFRASCCAGNGQVEVAKRMEGQFYSTTQDVTAWGEFYLNSSGTCEISGGADE